jgi:hypothetical protein
MGMASYAASFQLLPFLAWIVPAFLLAPTIPTMMACLHGWTAREKQIWSMLALVFAGVYAAVLAPLYYIEMTVVPYHLANGTTEGLALWLYEYHYPFNIPGALEAVGYVIVSLSFLFASQVFGRGRLQRWLRWTFVGYGLSGLPVFVDPLFRLPPFILLPDALANALFGILAPVLLAVLFRGKAPKMAVALV